MEHFVSTHQVEKGHLECVIGDHIVKMDVAAAEGTQAAGPSPKKLMLASLTGCTAIDIADILSKMKVSFSQLSVEAGANLTAEHPKMYKDVVVTYKIKLAAGDQDKMERAVKLSAEKYCGVMAMFQSFSEVKTEIVYL